VKFAAILSVALFLSVPGLRTQDISTPLHAQFAYVANSIIGPGNVSGYTISPATGALAAFAGSPFAAGEEPLSMAVDPSGKFAYVVNGGFPGTVSGFTIDPVTGALTAIGGSPFAAGVFSNSVAVHPSGKFVYVSNAGPQVVGDISGYTIDPVTGTLTAIAGSPSLREKARSRWR